MFAKPQSEHEWLERFLGDWDVHTECKMNPDEPPEVGESRLSVRSLGGLWLSMEGECEDPDGGVWTTVLTLGYDPQRNAYVGTFVGSMMTHLWLYEGTLDAAGKCLTLDTVGPSFDGSGMAKYQDVIEVIDDDHWVLASQVLGEDGSWTRFNTSQHRRRVES